MERVRVIDGGGFVDDVDDIPVDGCASSRGEVSSQDVKPKTMWGYMFLV